MSKLRVLITGASIAGPMTAYWLARAGASVTIVERFPQLRIGGQNVDIRSHGVSVMRKIPGMEEAVKSKVMQFDGISIVDADDKPCISIKPTGNPYQQSIVSDYEILRGDLSQILFDLTKDNENIRYIFGEQVTSIQQEKDDGPVRVKFANGLPADNFDLIVGCDGASSRTRALGPGCGAREFVNSSNRWAAYFTMKKDILNGGKIGKVVAVLLLLGVVHQIQMSPF